LFSDGSSTYPKLSKSCSKKITRRQDAPRCFDMNASIYAWRRESLLSMDSLFGGGTRLYEMPEVTAFDVDTEIDLEIVKILMNKYDFD
jgi:CMP-N,N'-diacetyllegionaminic acid synthase